MAVLRARAEGRRDDFKVGVALEGGGMRGVVSGAMLIALRDLGMSRHVDVYYGTSSGSINITYFAAGASWDALSVYYDHLPQGFVRRVQSLPFKSLLDMDYLRLVMTERVPLNVAALREPLVDARVVLCNVDTITTEVVPVSADPEAAVSLLLAGSWLPLLAGRPMKLNNKRYLDGGVLWADPLYAALDDGCTHVLALNTSPQDDLQSEHSKRMRAILTGVLNRWSLGLGDAYLAARDQWDRDRQLLPFSEGRMLGDGNVTRVAPAPGSHQVTRLTMDRGALLQGARAGYETILALFEKANPTYFAVASADRLVGDPE